MLWPPEPLEAQQVGNRIVAWIYWMVGLSLTTV